MTVPHRLGVCSWSLQPGDPRELAHRLRALGVDCCQLHLDPLREGRWNVAETRAALREAGVEVRSGMMSTHGEDYSTLESIRDTGGVRPTRHWKRNLEIAKGDAHVARELGLELVTFHAGFLPHDVDDPERSTMLERLRAIVDLYADCGVDIAFETGQERADTLIDVLEELDRPNAGVNFDPANMILYGMGEPVEALRLLASRVKQIHVKDAVRAKVAGSWGEEVTVGSGEVNWAQFFEVVKCTPLGVDLMVEREAGTDRSGDIGRALALVARHVELQAKA